MAHISGGAVAVICERFHNNGDSAGAIAFINDLFVIIRAAFTGCFFNDAVDIIVGHIIGLRLCNHIPQFGVRGWIRPAFPHRYANFTADFREDFCTLAVRFFLLALDRAPLGMS